MAIYTRTGDAGVTGLLSGERVPKDDLRIEFLGDMDELTSSLGNARSHLAEDKIADEIYDLQKKLINFMAAAADENKNSERISSKDVEHIEGLIDHYQALIPERHSFAIPGESTASSCLDIARAVARRAERSLIAADRQYGFDENLKKFLNRLSDYLYITERYVDFRLLIEEKVKEVLGKNNTSCAMVLNLSSAVKLIKKVEEKAELMKLPVVIAVAGETGEIIALHRMDGTLPASYDIAVNKAYTSAALRISTEELGKLAQPGGPLYGINTTNGSRIVIFGGGCTLNAEGKVVGGIGVSGGTAQQDIEIANYGASLFSSSQGTVNNCSI
jgi:cob(I)alamin adenosyltransferase